MYLPVPLEEESGGDQDATEQFRLYWELRGRNGTFLKVWKLEFDLSSHQALDLIFGNKSNEYKHKWKNWTERPNGRVTPTDLKDIVVSIQDRSTNEVGIKGKEQLGRLQKDMAALPSAAEIEKLTSYEVKQKNGAGLSLLLFALEAFLRQHDEIVCALSYGWAGRFVMHDIVLQAEIEELENRTCITERLERLEREAALSIEHISKLKSSRDDLVEALPSLQECHARLLTAYQSHKFNGKRKVSA